MKLIYFSRHSRWGDVKKKFDSDPRYKTVESSSLKEDYFMDFVHDLKDDHRTKSKKDKKDRKRSRSRSPKGRGDRGGRSRSRSRDRRGRSRSKSPKEKSKKSKKDKRDRSRDRSRDKKDEDSSRKDKKKKKSDKVIFLTASCQVFPICDRRDFENYTLLSKFIFFLKIASLKVQTCYVFY